MVTWSPQQDKALKQTEAWLKDPAAPQVFKIFGYAGTGKTTLAKTLASSCSNVAFAAYTGKAAHVLTQKGCPATTLHQLIYKPTGFRNERFRQIKNTLERLEEIKPRTPDVSYNLKVLEHELAELRRTTPPPTFELNDESYLRSADLLIVDEVSMVSERLALDLLSFGKKILVLGDPFQLPPVNGAGFFTEGEPDVMLTEVHRQALENPITYLATHVRNRRELTLGDYGTSRVIIRKDLLPEDPLSVDQVLVGRNSTRRSCNQRIRKIKGHDDPLPVAGDRLVCLRNKGPLFNGSIWFAKSDADVDPNRTYKRDGSFLLDLAPEIDSLKPLSDQEVHSFTFLDSLRKIIQDELDFHVFDFGYALTVHKSQGSEWGSVLLLDESPIFEDRFRHLYTGLTRASDQVIVAI